MTVTKIWNVSKPIQNGNKVNWYAKYIHIELRKTMIGCFQAIFKKKLFWPAELKCALYLWTCRNWTTTNAILSLGLLELCVHGQMMWAVKVVRTFSPDSTFLVKLVLWGDRLHSQGNIGLTLSPKIRGQRLEILGLGLLNFSLTSITIILRSVSKK